MKNNLKRLRIKLIAVALLLTAFNCEKENADETISQQELFNAPSIESAKQFFNHNSKYTNANEIQAKNTFSSLQTDWQVSKTKKYKETQQADVDILYTPIYLDTDKDANAFVASTEQNGNVESKIIFILHKTNNNQNGLSAYVFMYNLNGTLELEYNFENGQSIPFTENANGLQAKTNCATLPNLTPEEIMQWLSDCTIALDEVVVIGHLSEEIDAGDSGGGGLDISPWIQIDGLGYEGNTYGVGGGNPQVFVSSTVSATGFSISTALGLPFSSLQSQWLTQQTTNNQSLLNAIAQFLNNNKKPSPDPLFVNVNPNQLPEIMDEAISYAASIINSGVDGTLITALPFFKYPDGTNYASIYPELTWLLQERIPMLKDNTHLINTITTLTGISEQEVKNHLTWGEGPEVHITDLGFAPDGTAYKGKFNPSEPDRIYIDIDLVDYFEQNAVDNGETTTLAALRSLIVFGVCLHELVHFADFDFDGLMQDNVNLELGELFEQIAIGGHYEFNPNGEVIFIKF